MIVNIKHKGLRAFYQKGDSSKLQPIHVGKIRLILTRLEAAVSVEDLNVPGYKLHQLTGNMYPLWSIKVDKNFRVIFRFEKDNVLDVDYLDYH